MHVLKLSKPCPTCKLCSASPNIRQAVLHCLPDERSLSYTPDLCNRPPQVGDQTSSPHIRQAVLHCLPDERQGLLPLSWRHRIQLVGHNEQQAALRHNICGSLGAGITAVCIAHLRHLRSKRCFFSSWQMANRLLSQALLLPYGRFHATVAKSHPKRA